MVINDVNQITPQTISNMTKTKNRKILTESEMVSLKNNLIQTKPVDLNDKTTYQDMTLTQNTKDQLLQLVLMNIQLKRHDNMQKYIKL